MSWFSEVPRYRLPRCAPRRFQLAEAGVSYRSELEIRRDLTSSELIVRAGFNSCIDVLLRIYGKILSIGLLLKITERPTLTSVG